MTAEIQTRTTVEGMRREVQAQLDQNCADIQCKDKENSEDNTANRSWLGAIDQAAE